MTLLSPGWYSKLKKNIRRILKVPVWSVRVRDCGGQNEDLNLLFAGHPVGKDYFLDLFSGHELEQKPLGDRWIWTLPLFNRKIRAKYGLAVFEGASWLRPFLAGTRHFMIPLWVDGRVLLEPEFIKKVFKRRKVQYEVGKIRRNGFEYRVVRDEKWLRFFYRRMYLPHLEKHYGRLALVTSYEDIESRFRRYDGEIFFVKDGDRFVAGMILIYTEKGVVMDKVAVLDGDDRHLRSGASAALYYFCIQYLLPTKQKYFWLGGSRAFLNDGVLNYKQKWGLEVHGRYRRFFFLWPVSYSPAVQEFLAQNPFIFLDKGQLAGAVFLREQDDERQKDLEWLRRRYHARGLSRLIVFRAPTAGDRPETEALFRASE